MPLKTIQNLSSLRPEEPENLLEDLVTKRFQTIFNLASFFSRSTSGFVLIVVMWLLFFSESTSQVECDEIRGWPEL